jgi:microcystin-dependent protein
VPYVGEIRIFAGNFAPAGWAFCEGQILPIADNETLFFVLGTRYGGDGVTTYGLPNLLGRLPVHQGSGFVMGATGGVEEVTLTTDQTPSHTHPLVGSSQAATKRNPENAVLGQALSQIYINDTPATSLGATAIGSIGGSEPHNNLQPFLCVNYIISLFGLYPSAT